MGLARLPLLDLIFVYFGVGTCDFLKDSGDFGFKSACSGDLASSLDCGCGVLKKPEKFRNRASAGRGGSGRCSLQRRPARRCAMPSWMLGQS